MKRVMYNRCDEPYYSFVRTVIIQPPDCCIQCEGRVDCLILDTIFSCHIKVEWFVPKYIHAEKQRIFVWRKFHIPTGHVTSRTGRVELTYLTDNNNGNPVEKYATHLDENFKRLTGLTLEEYEEKLRT